MRAFLIRSCVFFVLVGGLAVVQAITYTASERITVGATVPVGFTASLINAGNGHGQATSAMCRVETAQIRWTVDPFVLVTASTNGVLAEIGEWLPSFTDSMLITNFRAVRTGGVGGTNGVLACFYFG